MNYNTFLIRYGIEPKCFKNKELFPIKTDTGFLYELEQETQILRVCPECNSRKIYIKGYRYNMHIKTNSVKLSTCCTV